VLPYRASVSAWRHIQALCTVAGIAAPQIDTGHVPLDARLLTDALYNRTRAGVQRTQHDDGEEMEPLPEDRTEHGPEGQTASGHELEEAVAAHAWDVAGALRAGCVLPSWPDRTRRSIPSPRGWMWSAPTCARSLPRLWCGSAWRHGGRGISRWPGEMNQAVVRVESPCWLGSSSMDKHELGGTRPAGTAPGGRRARQELSSHRSFAAARRLTVERGALLFACDGGSATRTPTRVGRASVTGHDSGAPRHRWSHGRVHPVPRLHR